MCGGYKDGKDREIISLEHAQKLTIPEDDGHHGAPLSASSTPPALIFRFDSPALPKSNESLQPLALLRRWPSSLLNPNPTVRLSGRCKLRYT